MTRRDQVLELLRKEPGLTPATIIIRTGIGESHLSAILSDLRRDGLATREPTRPGGKRYWWSAVEQKQVEQV